MGCPHDSILARRRAEAFALPLFRQRLLGFLAEVVASSNPHSVPPCASHGLEKLIQEVVDKGLIECTDPDSGPGHSRSSALNGRE